MVDDFRKSVNSILYERITSPLFGTFLISWLIWNWKIVFVMFLTDNAELTETKFDYIDTNLLNIWNGVVFPVLSTSVLLTGYNYLSELALKVWLYFRKRKKDLKQKYHDETLLTHKESMNIRIEMKNVEEKFATIIKDKDNRIEVLKSELANIKHRVPEKSVDKTEMGQLAIFENDDTDMSDYQNSRWSNELDDFLKNKDISNVLYTMVDEIGSSFTYLAKIKELKSVDLSFLEVNNIVNVIDEIVELTKKGKYFTKIILNKKYNKN